MDDVEGLAIEAQGVLTFGGPPPRSRPCPVKGINDVMDGGFDTMPPCVGLASFGSLVSGDPADGDVTVIVELPLFFTVPAKPVTVFPLPEVVEVVKYPDIAFPLGGLTFLSGNPVQAFPFTGLLVGSFG